MEDLNLFSLKCFVDAVLMGSISESARRNFVSQSAVSQSIKKLETSLNVPLCIHKKQQFKLTEEGKIAFEKAKAIFHSVRDLKSSLDAYLEHPRTPIHFVTTHSIGLSLLPHFLSNFRQLHPQIEVQFLLGGITQIKGWLKQGITEFALLVDSSNLSEYQLYPVYEGQFHLYKGINETHSLESLKSVGVFVENREGLLISKFQESFQSIYHHPFRIAVELNSWELIARCLEQGNGYGLLPDFITHQSRYSQLISIPTPSLPYT